MTRHIHASTKSVGSWSAVLATAFSLMYIVGQLAEWFGMLGSLGGPESDSTPLGIVVLLTPSLFLGPSFLVLMVSVHQLAPAETRVWSHTAVVCATVYAVLVGMVYFVQLTWIAPRLVSGRVEGTEAFLFVPFDSFLYAVDILGYSFMSLATLFAARVFSGRGLEQVARRFLTELTGFRGPSRIARSCKSIALRYLRGRLGPGPHPRVDGLAPSGQRMDTASTPILTPGQ